MNAEKIFAGLVIFTNFLVVSCDKELVSSGYPTVVLNSVPGQADENVFSATIMKNGYRKVDRTGFIWQIEEDPLVRPGFELRCAALDQFAGAVNYSLKKDKNYKVRAFARCGEFLVFSEMMDFTAGNDLPCRLQTFYPDYGYAGDIVTISGKGFNKCAVYNTVMFDNQLSTIKEANDSVLKCVVPSELSSAGPKTIKVYVNGVETSFTYQFNYRVHEYPVIYSVSRKSVKYGTTLELYGKYFNNASAILMSGNSQVFKVTPLYSGTDTLKIEIYNHQNLYEPLNFSSFKIGLVYSSGISWSEQISIVSSWTRMADLPSNSRYKAGAFSLGGYIYVGGGADNGLVLKDLWRYNPQSNSWTRMADIPGNPRVYPIGSASSSNGFMGAGFSADNSSKYQFYDFYKYDPQNNSWSSIPDFPDPINNFFFNYSTSINGRPFFGLSNAVPLCREIENDNWVSHSSVTDLMDSPANGVLTIGNCIYVITGFRSSGVVNKSVWEFNTVTDTWTRKNDFPGSPKHSPVFFSIGKFGYYGCGRSFDAEQYKDMWRYDPSNDKWIRIEDFPGGLRSHTISASYGKCGYTGFGVLLSPVTYYKDFWQYNPE